jgi:hypothetical protein
MAYIGTKPTVGNFQICDAISVVNGQAAYTMQVGSVNVIPQSANHMIVSLNGTIQKPNSSFTVSGSTITFASNLATGDVIDFIQILGNVLDLGVPSDGTVTSAKLNLTSAVGIGESSPGTLLDIKGSPGANNRITINSSEAGSNAQVLGGIVIENQGDSVVQISGRRESATDDGYFAIETQATGGSLTERVRIHSGGVMSAANGIALGVGTANTASNVLDDYEEGTFTPQLKISGSTTGITYSAQAGHYTKIGNRAIVNMEIALSAKGSNTGNVSLIGLPFTTSNDNYQTAYVYNDRVSSPNGDVQAYVLSNNTNINFYQSRTDGTNNGNLTGNELNSNSYLIMFATYKTA